jgi:hypothetical protein
VKQHRTVRFKVLYLRGQEEWGREWNTLTVNRHGERTMRCLCEMDDRALLRDVTYTVDRDFRPLDCFNRVTINGDVLGTTWFRFAGTRVEAEAFTAAEGRVSQVMEFPTPPISFMPHPVALDIWHWANIAPDPARIQMCEPLPSSSPTPYGTTGPLIASHRLRARYGGHERITTRAGTFDCLKAAYLRPDDSTILDMWCTDDSDRIMVRMEWPPENSSFELVELERS